MKRILFASVLLFLSTGAFAAQPKDVNVVDTEFEPYQDTKEDNDNSVFASINPFIVPDGKRLVVQHVSLFIDVPTGQTVISTSIVCKKQGGEIAIHTLVPFFLAAQPTRDRYVASQQLTCYHDASEGPLFILVSRNVAVETFEVASAVSGILVDEP